MMPDKLPPTPADAAIQDTADRVIAEICRRVMGDAPVPVHLTASEIPIVIRLGRGKTVAEIASELELGQVDVTNRIARLLRRECITRTKLIVFAAFLAVGTNGKAA